jgi:hypothetical protein
MACFVMRSDCSKLNYITANTLWYKAVMQLFLLSHNFKEIEFCKLWLDIFIPEGYFNNTIIIHANEA